MTSILIQKTKRNSLSIRTKYKKIFLSHGITRADCVGLFQNIGTWQIKGGGYETWKNRKRIRNIHQREPDYSTSQMGSNKKDAEIYTNERDLHHDLAVLSNDYTALEFKILEIKGE